MTLMVNQLVGFGVGEAPIGGNDEFTKLLLHFDGTDASTTITDSSASAHTVVAEGNAQLDTAQFKFGSASCLFDGGNDDIYASDASADYNLGTGDFTVDFWVRFNGTARAVMFEVRTSVAMLIITASSGLVEVFGPATNVISAGSTAFSTGVWYHIALVRSGNSWVVYRDGTSYVTATDSRSWGASNDLLLGLRANLSLDFNGWIDEFRWSKGVARWTSDFTPPAGPYD